MNTSSSPAGSWTRDARDRALRAAAVAVAAVAQVIVLVPFTVASGLLAPLWAVVMLSVMWAAAAVGLALLARPRPFATLLVPVVNMALWWLTMTAGAHFLGWTA